MIRGSGGGPSWSVAIPRAAVWVAAASYEARAFGVRSAMPMRTALRLCPGAVRVSPDFSRYREVSRQIREIFKEHTNLVEPVALDEAYLDVTHHKRGIPFGHRAARSIKAEIRTALGLTASAGVAPCKFVAKVASDLDKPDGLVTVMPHQVCEFLHPLPVGRIPGVGEVTRGQLKAMGVETIGQLAEVDASLLEARLGKRGRYLHQRALGIDDEPVTTEREPKQLSSESTFSTDLLDPKEMHAALRTLAEEVAGRLRRRGLEGAHGDPEGTLPRLRNRNPRPDGGPASRPGRADAQSRRGPPGPHRRGAPRGTAPRPRPVSLRRSREPRYLGAAGSVRAGRDLRSVTRIPPIRYRWSSGW